MVRLYTYRRVSDSNRVLRTGKDFVTPKFDQILPNIGNFYAFSQLLNPQISPFSVNLSKC